MATWRRGYAADCKSVYPGSIPGVASILCAVEVPFAFGQKTRIGTRICLWPMDLIQQAEIEERLMDFEQARKTMVETQLRPSGVTDPALLHALRQIARERFVPPAQRVFAYGDLDIPLQENRQLLASRTLARLIQALAIQPGDRVLEIAGATGYGGALMASLGGDVTVLEPSPDLSFMARAALDGCGFGSVKIVSTDCRMGWAEGAFYDAIMLHGAAQFVPDAWLSQLKEGGRLALILREGAAGSARLFTKSRGVCGYRVLFDAQPAIVPGLEKAPAFVF